MKARVLTNTPADVEALRTFGGDAATAAWFLTTPGCVAVASFDEDTSSVAGLAYGQELAHPDGRVTMLLYSLDVLEQWRRRGHGRAVVEAFVAEATHRGCREVWVLTDDGNPAAIATYSSAGGERDATGQVMFVWSLPASATMSCG